MLASGGPLLDEVAAAGPAVEVLPALAPTPGDDDLAHVLWRRAAAMAPATRDLLAPHRPDLVVTDTITTVGFFAADLLGVPTVEVSPHHLMDPSPHVPPVGLGRAPSRLPWRRWDDASIRRRQATSWEQAVAQRTAARASLGLGPEHGAVRRLLAVPPCLEHPRPDWPADAVAVGPLSWEPPSWRAAGASLEAPSGEGPLVLVTDSTASGDRPGLAATAIDALAHADVRVVATSSDPRAVAAAERAGNAVVGRGSHAALLEGADLAVCPGGGGFVGKAVAAGVPLVVVPGPGDQREAARRVAVAGVGRRVPPGPGLGVRLRWNVLLALADPRLRTRVAACAEDADEGPARAVAEVEAVLARQ